MPFSYKNEATDQLARAGLFQTPRGLVKTPCFMPVGTKATVKALTPRDLKEIGSQIILANTFHLHLRPGEELIERMGELHEFMKYDGPILTDSGGFQVFSLAELREITEEGVAFKSPLDGSACFLSPEKSMEIQKALGSNMIMAFDECPPADADDVYNRGSMERTLRWLERCATVPLKEHQTLFPIVQGGMFEQLREESCARTLEIIPDAEGYAVGGLAVGEGRDMTYRMLKVSVSGLPVDKPRYMMGVGTPEDLVWAVDKGIDLFDCVLPTRNARNARVFVPGGALNLRNASFKEEKGPIMEGCDCYACKERFSRSYLHHLHRAGEMLGGMLASIHNVRYLIRQCEEMRSAILEGKWEEYKNGFFALYKDLPEDPSLKPQD